MKLIEYVVSQANKKQELTWAMRKIREIQDWMNNYPQADIGLKISQ